MKPKSLRVIILALILLTVIIGLYHLLYGEVAEPLPTEPAMPLQFQNNHPVSSGQSVYSSMNNDKQCAKMDQFTPEVDSLDVYPTLDFNVRDYSCFCKNLW